MSDNLYVNRNNTTYQVDMENLRSVEDTDLLLVNRDGVTYTVTGDKIGTGGGNSGSITTPVEVLTPVNGAGMSDDPITPLSTAITNVGGAGSYVPETSNITDVQQVGINEPYATQVTTTNTTIITGSSPGFMFDGDPNTSFKVNGFDSNIFFNCQGIPGFDIGSNIQVRQDLSFSSTDPEVQWNYVDGTSSKQKMSGEYYSKTIDRALASIQFKEPGANKVYNMGWKSISVDGVELTGNYQIGFSTELTLENSTNLNLFKQGDFVKGAVGSTQSAAFSATIYTGNAATRTISTGIDNTGKSLLWTKVRNKNDSHSLTTTFFPKGSLGFYDTMRPESTETISIDNPWGVSSWKSDGYELGGTNRVVNELNSLYVAWNFRAAPGFMDIVTFDQSTDQIPHSLNSTPGMIIVKRNDKGEDWWVYHGSLDDPTQNYLKLNATADKYAGVPGNWEATNSYFKFNIIDTGGEYAAYLFADTPGLIKCGSYTEVVGLEVDCGFKPAWLMVKSTSITGLWAILDNKRGTNWLRANDVDDEDTSFAAWELTDTGFKIAQSQYTASAKVIYVAIAEGAMAGEYGPTGALLEDASNSKINLINTAGVWESGGPVAKGAIDAALELTFQSSTNLDLMVGPVKMTDENGNVKIATTSAISNDSRTESNLWTEGAPTNPLGMYPGNIADGLYGAETSGSNPKYIFRFGDNSGNTTDGAPSALNGYCLISDNGIDNWRRVEVSYSSPNTGSPRIEGLAHGFMNNGAASAPIAGTKNWWLSGVYNFSSGGGKPAWSLDGETWTALEYSWIANALGSVGSAIRLNYPIITSDNWAYWSVGELNSKGFGVLRTADLVNYEYVGASQQGTSQFIGGGQMYCGAHNPFTGTLIWGGYCSGWNDYSTLGYISFIRSVNNGNTLEKIRIGNYPSTFFTPKYICNAKPAGSPVIWVAASAERSDNLPVMYYSQDDGINWSACNIPSSIRSIGGLAYGDGKFMALNKSQTDGPNSPEQTSITSVDGINWEYAGGIKLTDENGYSITGWGGLAYGEGKFVAMSREQKKAGSQSGGCMYTSKLIDSKLTFTDTTEFEYFKGGDTVACSNGAAGTLDSDPNLAAKTMDISVTSGTFSNGTTVTGNPVSAGATDVMYVDGNKVGLDGVTPTWLEDFFMQGATVTDFGPSPTDVHTLR